MNDPVQIYQTLLTRLEALRQNDARVKLFFATVIAISLLVSLTLISFVGEAVFHFPPIVRLSFLILIFGGSLLAFGWLGILPFLKKPLLEQIALKVENKFPELAQRLIGTLQLWSKRESNPEGYSVEIIEALVAETDQIARGLDFESVIDKSSMKRAWRVFGIGLLAFTLVCILFPSRMKDSLYYYLHPMLRSPNEETLTISVWPKDIEITKGQNLTVRVKVQGPKLDSRNPKENDRGEGVKLPSGVELYSKVVTGKKWIRTYLPLLGGQTAFTWKEIRDPFNYYVQAGKEKTKRFEVKLIEKLGLTGLDAAYRYPLYTGLGAKIERQITGDLTALVGTKVRLDILANVVLGRVTMITEKERYNARIDGHKASVDFRISKNDIYRLELEDKRGRRYLEPFAHKIEALKDEFPIVRIVEPGEDTRIAEDMLLHIVCEGQDDFGFSGLNLVYKINNSPEKRFPLQIHKGQKAEIREEFVWDLSKLNLLPEDKLRYYAEIYDNDDVSGPKSARSAEFIARLPSISEIFAESEEVQEKQIVRMEDVAKESKKLKENLDKLQRDLLREQRLSWEEKKDLEAALEKQKAMTEALKQMSDQIQDAVQKLEKNDVLSMETVMKLQQLQQLMQEIVAPELKKALENLQRSLSQIDPRKIEQAMKDFKFSQQEFQERLERTISLLKRLQMEQKMDAVTKAVDELVRRQSDVNENLKNVETFKEQAEKEKRIGTGLTNLKKDMTELSEMMRQEKERTSDKIDSLSQFISKQKLPEKAFEMADMINSGNRTEAQTSGKKILADLQKLVSGMRTTQAKMKEDFKQRLAEELRRMQKELLYLSDKQEDIASQTSKLRTGGQSMSSLAEQQQELLNGANQMADKILGASQKTFFIPPEVGRSMGRSLAKMDEAVASLEQRNVGIASARGFEAMESLNRTVVLLRNSLSQLSRSASGTGFEEMMQQLQTISDKQSQINAETESLPIPQPGGLAPGNEATMLRLAAEQEALRKSMEELSKKMSSRSDVQYRLGQMADEMKKVVEDLQHKQVNPQTIERQRRILSRLLDAQRSVRQRDYSKERVSETAKKYTPKAPLELPSDLGQRKDLMREEFLNVLQEGYPSEYQNLIRRYYEAITEEAQKAVRSKQ